MTQSRSQARPKRVITVDGIRYSLDTGDSFGAARRKTVVARSRVLPRTNTGRKRAARVPEQPLPKAVTMTSHHQAVMHPDPRLAAAQALHPHNVSHPALPLQQRQIETGRQRMSVWRDVIKPSFTDSRDSVSIWASVGIVLLSPLTWLAILIPAALIFFAQLQDRPIAEIYRWLAGWISKTSASEAAIYLGLAAAFVGVIWFVRHVCLTVAYALASRKVDNRPVSSRAVWWQAAGKMWRLVWVALFEGLLFITVTLLLSTALKLSLQVRTESATQWSLLFNLTLVFAILFVVIISIYRPLSRVMLALTNRPAGVIITRGFALLVRNWLPALGLGFVWLGIAGLTAALVSAVSWATLAYGLLQITTLLGRLILLTVAGLLIMLLLVAFTIWNVDFWPRSYRWLAIRAYPNHVSRFMAGALAAKPKSTIIWQGISLVIVYAALIGGLSFGLWAIGGAQYQALVKKMPPSLDLNWR